jgi:hypothetical protein
MRFEQGIRFRPGVRGFIEGVKRHSVTAKQVPDRGEADGGRRMPKSSTARRLEALRDLLTGQDIVSLVLAGTHLEASQEGRDTSWRDISDRRSVRAKPRLHGATSLP